MTRGLLLGLLAAAILTGLALVVLVPWLRRVGVVDVPVERSLHRAPVVRGAGLALLPGIVLGAVLGEGVLSTADITPHGAASPLYLILGLVTIFAFAGIGLSDDLFSHGVASRLAIQLVVGLLSAAAVLAVTGGRFSWLVPVAIGFVGCVNIVNFMDGANGLLALHGLVTATWFGAIAWHHGLLAAAVLAAATGGALLAFLPVNLRGRAFLGDVGSYAIGATWGVLGLWLLLAGIPVEAVLAPAAVFLADFAYTLQLRIRAGDRWYRPHKLHVYQRLISAGWPHAASSAVVAGVAAACSLLTLPALLGASLAVRAVCIGFGLLLLLAYLRLPVLSHAPEPWHDARAQPGTVTGSGLP